VVVDVVARRIERVSRVSEDVHDRVHDGDRLTERHWF
jgi:hypothetical protein